MRRRRRWAIAAMVLATSALGLLPAPAGARPTGREMTAQACATTPTSGTEQRTIAGYPGRPYRVRVPSGLSGPARLLVSIHGWSTLSLTPALDNENNSGLNAFASQTKSIVVYPTGSFVSAPGVGGPTSFMGWNYWDDASTDIAYLRAVVSHVSAEFCVNPDRVHADGISMGGLMSERLLCEAGDVFASTSGHATNDVTAPWVDDPAQPGGTPDPCDPPASAAFLLSCAGNDPAVGTACDQVARPAWRDRLACTNPDPAPAAVPFGTFRDYACTAGRDLRWRMWDGLGHAYPQQYSPLFPFVVDTARRDRWISELSQFYDANQMP